MWFLNVLQFVLYYVVLTIERMTWNVLGIGWPWLSNLGVLPTTWVIPLLIVNIGLTFSMGTHVDPEDKTGKAISWIEMACYLLTLLFHWIKIEKFPPFVFPAWLSIIMVGAVFLINAGQALVPIFSKIPPKGRLRE